MDADRERVVADIKNKIEQGSYRIDVRAVADAVVTHVRELALASREHVAPTERQFRLR